MEARAFLGEAEASRMAMEELDAAKAAVAPLDGASHKRLGATLMGCAPGPVFCANCCCARSTGWPHCEQ